MTEVDRLQESRKEFIGSIKDLLNHCDIFGENPVIVRVSSKDYSVSVTDTARSSLRTAFFDLGEDGFVFMDAEHDYHPFEGTVLKQGIISPIRNHKTP